METDTVIGRLLEAQRRNAALSGDELVQAAADVARLARRHRAVLVAHDGAGERIVGAALALHPRECRPGDVTTRYDGVRVLLVSGMIAAPHAIAQAIMRVRSLGAGDVHVALLGGWPEEIGGAVSITGVGSRPSPRSSAA